MPMMPIELDSSYIGILLMVDLVRKTAGIKIVAKISHPDAGTASGVRRLDDSSHHYASVLRS